MFYINIPLLVVLFIVSKIFDFLIQTSWEAEEKSKKIAPLLVHSFIYSFFSSVVTYLLVPLTTCQLSIIFVVLFVTHIFIDSRRPVLWWMKNVKLIKGDLSKKWGPFHIDIDQRMHELVILILAIVIK